MEELLPEVRPAAPARPADAAYRERDQAFRVRECQARERPTHFLMRLPHLIRVPQLAPLPAETRAATGSQREQKFPRDWFPAIPIPAESQSSPAKRRCMGFSAHSPALDRLPLIKAALREPERFNSRSRNYQEMRRSR